MNILVLNEPAIKKKTVLHKYGKFLVFAVNFPLAWFILNATEFSFGSTAYSLLMSASFAVIYALAVTLLTTQMCEGSETEKAQISATEWWGYGLLTLLVMVLIQVNFR